VCASRATIHCSHVAVERQLPFCPHLTISFSHAPCADTRSSRPPHRRPSSSDKFTFSWPPSLLSTSWRPPQQREPRAKSSADLLLPLSPILRASSMEPVSTSKPFLFSSPTFPFIGRFFFRFYTIGSEGFTLGMSHYPISVQVSLLRGSFPPTMRYAFSLAPSRCSS